MSEIDCDDDKAENERRSTCDCDCDCERSYVQQARVEKVKLCKQQQALIPLTEKRKLFPFLPIFIPPPRLTLIE